MSMVVLFAVSIYNIHLTPFEMYIVHATHRMISNTRESEY